MSEIEDGPASQKHVPVLLHETIDALNIRPGKVYVDATAGGGGHLSAIWEKLSLAGGGESSGRPNLIGIDRDGDVISDLHSRFADRVKLVRSNFAEIKEALAGEGVRTVDGGILADLGVSSMQLDQPERGFSFLREGPLDMRMDARQPLTAERLINSYSEEELAKIIYEYGEEKFSRSIARAIVKERPLHTTSQLADVVSRNVRHQRKRISKSNRYDPELQHPATRTFQAIRIAVNDELASLEKFLADCLSILAPGARLAVITFHSLEDRTVKQFLRRAASSCVCPPRLPVCTCHHQPEMLIITRKPIVAEEKEVLANIRSRSAKLRAGEKL